jgi:Cu+-exporting ATPase
MPTATCPVCKMKVDTVKTQHKTQHGPQVYHFCSAGCKQSFEKDPHRYLGSHAH